MRTTTRAWFVLSLLLLAGAALLHTVTLLGLRDVWPALVHLTLFGWISSMIVAVNYHTMPVFTGRDFPYTGPLWLQLGAQAVGAPLAAGGLLAALPGLVAAGLALELLAALLFVLNVLLLFARGARRGLPPVPGQRAVDRLGTRATTAAGLCLPLALALLLGVRLGLVSGAWWLAAEHLAALGWAMLMIVGVAGHVLPRFSGRGTRGAAWARAQLGMHLLGLALIVLGLGFGWGRLFAAGGVTMAAALALFAWTIWPTLRAVAARTQLITPTVKEYQP